MSTVPFQIMFRNPYCGGIMAEARSGAWHVLEGRKRKGGNDAFIFCYKIFLKQNCTNEFVFY